MFVWAGSVAMHLRHHAQLEWIAHAIVWHLRFHSSLWPRRADWLTGACRDMRQPDWREQQSLSRESARSTLTVYFLRPIMEGLFQLIRRQMAGSLICLQTITFKGAKSTIGLVDQPPTTRPKASAFDNMGMRIDNQLSYTPLLMYHIMYGVNLFLE